MAETFQRSSVSLTSTAVTDVYQAPNNAATDRAIVLSCFVSNIDGANSADISLGIYNSSNTLIVDLVKTIPVPGDAAIECVVNKLVLEQGEKIRATASAANDLAVTVSALEITQ